MISKLPNVTDSIFTIMSRLSQEHGAINLAQGFPNFSVDPILKDLHIKAIQEDKNQYAPMAGLLSLRAAISNMTQQQHKAFYNPENEICLTAGATQAIYCAIQTVVHPGDEVIIFTPAYDCYEPAIQLAGGKTISIPMTLPDFTIDWQEVKDKITSRTKMIMINTPHNPSGNVLSHQDMLILEEIVVTNNLVLLSDEVYEHIIYDGIQHRSAARYRGLLERSFITGSFGKTFHVTGWKMGYCLAPRHLMEEFYKIHQYMVFCVSHPVQDAMAHYLQKPERYLDLGKFYQRKRGLFLNLIQESKFTFKPAQGSYFQLLDYSAITDEGDFDFARRLTIEHKIASIPISVFMNGADPKILRFCFAKKDEDIIAAAKILNSL
ncbi:methionine aminotransferase [Nonlabens xylanidelens]|uniref:Methionine aminotransferase n=1 Tax=Nonlabens xylanidelens TaxID=191564 RepID=A0A2S6IR78_9FLAO|nr:methionine aminotransferase [Nonlabens xylanidelens]PPK96762.1 methionine aminotransferase [Nonlabens xylanidelens]PQJ13469.1 methionine aminotransferase [Nonlabens xylanidelens]